jgi:hypothetical protein
MLFLLALYALVSLFVRCIASRAVRARLSDREMLSLLALYALVSLIARCRLFRAVRARPSVTFALPPLLASYLSRPGINSLL